MTGPTLNPLIRAPRSCLSFGHDTRVTSYPDVCIHLIFIHTSWSPGTYFGFTTHILHEIMIHVFT